MANYEIDEVTVTDGNVVTLNKNDIIVGLKDDATKIIILRAIFSR